MELNEFLKYMESGAEIEAGSEAHLCMHKLSQEAIRLTTELNGSYHTNEEIVEIMCEITGRRVDETFSLVSAVLYRLRKEFEDWEKSVLQCGCQDSGSGRRHNR